MYLDSNNNKLYKCKANTDSTNNTSSLFDLYSISNLVDNPDVHFVQLQTTQTDTEEVVDCKNAKFVFVEAGKGSSGNITVNLSKIINRDRLYQIVFLRPGMTWSLLTITNFYYRRLPSSIEDNNQPQNTIILDGRYANAIFYIAQSESHRHIFYSHSFNGNLQLAPSETP